MPKKQTNPAFACLNFMSEFQINLAEE